MLTKLQSIVNKYIKDIVVILGLISIGIVIILIVLLVNSNGERVNVIVDGSIVKTFDLNEDTEYVIESESGTNTICIMNGKVFMKDASCPDKLCINMGKISRSGQAIICLPNKVSVEIEGSLEDADTIAY